MIRGSITNPTEDEILKGKLPGNVNYGIQGPSGPKGSDGGYYIPDVKQIDRKTAEINFTPSDEGMPSVNPAQIELPINESSGENAGFVVQDTSPDDTSVLWVDPTDNSDDGFQEAVNTALAQAKASGEFDGKDGQDGNDGTSVTVKSVSESTADGGENVVTFSDGKTLVVKNGKTGAPGADGKTPVKCTDYWTTADRQQMVADVLAALPAAEGGSF